MKRYLIASFVWLCAAVAHAQYYAYQNWCQTGGKNVLTSGLPSATTVQQSLVACTVTVYLTGTTTKATIYSNSTGTALGNPFTANTDGSWIFYATSYVGYDIVMNGGIAPNTFQNPFTLTDVIIGSGASPPNLSIQFNNGSNQFLGDSSFTFNTTTKNVTAQSINFIQNIGSLSGANPYDTFVTNCNAGSVNCVLYTDPTQGNNAPTNSSAAPMTGQELFANWNGQNCTPLPLPSSNSRNLNGLCLYKVETRQDVFPTPGAIANGFGAMLGVDYYSEQGGLYGIFNGSIEKSNRYSLYTTYNSSTVAQNWDIGADVHCYTGGECFTIGGVMQMYGGWLSSGQVADSFAFIQLQQGSESDGNGGVWTATAGTISGTTVPFTNPTNGQTLGEARFIRDLNIKTPVTVSGVVCSGSGPETCTVTFSTATIPNCLANPHTTWNGLASSGQILTNNMVLGFTGNDGFDVAVPVTNCSATNVTVNLDLYGTGPNTGWFGSWPTASSSTAYSLTAAAPGNGTIIYTGTITNGANNALTGKQFVVTGFTNAGNNVTATCTASSATTLTLSASTGVNESASATATYNVVFNIYGSTWPVKVNIASQNFNSNDVTGITSGDVLDQVLAYNEQQIGIQMTLNNHIGPGNRSVGYSVTFNGDSGSALPEIGYAINGPFTEAIGIGFGGTPSLGQPSYIIASNVGSAHSMFGTIATFNDATTGTISQSIQKFLQYQDSTLSQVSPLNYDRNTGNSTAGFNLYSTFYFNPYANSGNGAVGIGAVAPTSAWLQVGGNPAYPLGVTPWGISVGINPTALASTPTMADFRTYAGITKGVKIEEGTSQPLPNGDNMFEVDGLTGGTTPAIYVASTDNGAGVLNWKFEQGMIIQGFNAASAMTWTINSSTGTASLQQLDQIATKNFAGSCSMSSSTTCTVTPMAASFTSTPLCMATAQGSTAYYGSCAVTGTAGSYTLTITANASNSATWAAMLIGNPN